MRNESPEALVSVREIADLMGTDPATAKAELDAVSAPPAGNYRGKPLWRFALIESLIDLRAPE